MKILRLEVVAVDNAVGRIVGVGVRSVLVSAVMRGQEYEEEDEVGMTEVLTEGKSIN